MNLHFGFHHRIELLYTPIYPCENDVILPPIDPKFQTCQEYWDSEADSMRDRSFLITYGCIGTIAATMIGNMLLFYGFVVAAERMNKRVRDDAFVALVRQEVGYFDVHPVAILTSRMSDDAALLQSFSGEPIRTLIMNTASVAVGLIVSFVFMWPFALITL
jgi:ATP-binding cassette subfamily B (MDR/TAP) protein 1